MLVHWRNFCVDRQKTGCGHLWPRRCHKTASLALEQLSATHQLESRPAVAPLFSTAITLTALTLPTHCCYLKTQLTANDLLDAHTRCLFRPRTMNDRMSTVSLKPSAAHIFFQHRRSSKRLSLKHGSSLHYSTYRRSPLSHAISDLDGEKNMDLTGVLNVSIEQCIVSVRPEIGRPSSSLNLEDARFIRQINEILVCSWDSQALTSPTSTTPREILPADASFDHSMCTDDTGGYDTSVGQGSSSEGLLNSSDSLDHLRSISMIQISSLSESVELAFFQVTCHHR